MVLGGVIMESKYRCSICDMYIKNSDQVVMDQMYFIRHPECYEYRHKYIKDRGTLYEIAGRYPDWFQVVQ